MGKMKRIMGMLLALVMVLGLMPGMSLTAFAATEYDLWVGATQVTSDNASDVLPMDPVNQGKVSYNPGTNTLTLNGVNITTTHMVSGGSYCIYSGMENLIIELKGNNTIGDINNRPSGGISARGFISSSLTIQGNGTLNVVASDNAILAANKLTISGGNITAKSDSSCIVGSYNLLISGGEITAECNSENCICATYQITISGGTVTAKADKYSIFSSYDITISGGNVTAASNSGAGILLHGNITISGGDVTAIGSVGIQSGGNITLGNNMIKLEATAPESLYAIAAGNNISKGDKLTITTPEGGEIKKLTGGGYWPWRIVDSDGSIANHVIIAHIFDIAKAEASNGSFTVSSDTAMAGDEITVTATPNTGYAVDTMTYTDSEGEHDIPSAGTFTMPASDVTVSVTFIKKNVQSVTLDKTEASLTAGDQVALTATVLPADAADRTVKWSVGGTNPGAVKLYSDQACTKEVGADATSVLTVYARGVSAGKAAVTVAGNSDSTKTASCAVTVTETAGSYSQKSAQGAEHILGEDKDAVYTITNSADDNRAFERFTQVSMDGQVIAAENYTKAKGSLVLTLKSAYLNTLSAGEHTVKISFSDGEVNTSLNILASAPTPTPKPTATPTATPTPAPVPTATPTATPTPTPVPKTGDTSMPFLWLMLIVAGMLGIGTLTAVRRRK